MVNSVNVGLVGTGRFGRLILSVLKDNSDVNIVAICNRSQDKVIKTASEFSVPDYFTNYNDMLEKKSLDACFVVTDEDSHAEIAIAALNAGCHVYVEKPLATSTEAGKKVRSTAIQKGLQIQVGYILRFVPENAYLKTEIDKGNFGKIGSIRVKRNCSRQWFHDFGKRINLVYETGCHDIDLILYLTGQTGKKVYATQRNILGYENSDLITAMLELSDGTQCFLETSWLAPDMAPVNIAGALELAGVIDSEIEIIGELQTARSRLLDSSLQIWSDTEVRRPDLALWPYLHGKVAGALKAEIDHFISCIRDNRESDVQSIDQAIEVMCIADAVVDSAQSGREVYINENI